MIDDKQVLSQILTTSNNIDGNIKSELSRNDVITMVANIVAQLRHLVEWCGVFCCLKDYPNQPILNDVNKYKVIQNAFKELKSKNKLNFLIKFHDMLQRTTSHYTYNYQLDNEYSFFKELLIYTWELKKYFNEKYKIQILSNFKNIYPLLEPPLHDQEFYAKIYSILKEQKHNKNFSKVKYYIVKKTLFLSLQIMFYFMNTHYVKQQT